MNFPSPVMGRRMGRPPMNLEETKVRLTGGSKARITALVGEQQMAAFIRKAVDEKIEREEKADPSKGQPEHGLKPMPAKRP